MDADVERMIQDSLRAATQVAAVLLVDDEPLALEALVRSLRRQPWRILTAPDAASALAHLAGGSVQAVVTDHDMPGRDGLDLLREVRQRWPDTVRCILTGKATLEMALAAINQDEVHRFFVKPCPTEELAAGIHQGLEHRHLLLLARRLLAHCRSQRKALQALDQEHPGIARIPRTADGAIDLDALLQS